MVAYLCGCSGDGPHCPLHGDHYTPVVASASGLEQLAKEVAEKAYTEYHSGREKANPVYSWTPWEFTSQTLRELCTAVARRAFQVTNFDKQG